MQQMLQKILDSLPENSPLVPYIKDGGDLALVCVFLALLLMPPDDMARIANEMMEESGFVMPDKEECIPTVEHGEILRVLKTERECVSRNCDRDCGKCDLSLEQNEILSVYDTLIAMFSAEADSREEIND